MIIRALRDTVDGYTSDWRISRHPRIKLLSVLIITHMRGKVLLAIALLLTLFLGHISNHVRPDIIDVSWPNCHEKLADYQTGVVGITGGRNFHANPCLAQEANHFITLSAYINTGYPGKAYGRHFQHSPRDCSYNDTYCLAYNYGYNAALYAIHDANLNNVHTNTWWLDVETVNSWSNNFLANRYFINGAVAGIRSQIWHPTVGIYSAPLQWKQLMGAWHNHLPEWLATGSARQATAHEACHTPSFTGATIQLTQYSTTALDYDLTCQPNKDLLRLNW